MAIRNYLLSAIAGGAVSAGAVFAVLSPPTDSRPGDAPAANLAAPQEGSSAVSAMASTGLAVSAFCNKTDQQLLEWRDTQITLLFKPTYPPDTPKVLFRDDVNTKAKEAFDQLDECIRAQPTRFEPGTALGNELGNFIRFVKALHWMAIKEGTPEAPVFPHQLGFEISDRDYYEKVKARVTVPGLLSSKEFMTALSSPSTYARALELIDEHNKSLSEDQRWTPVFMKTQFITTVDFGHGIPSNPDAPRATYGRLLVYLPRHSFDDGAAGDLWVLFGIVTPDMPQDTPMHNVSVFASLPATDSPNSEYRTVTYSMDNWRDIRADGTVRITPTVLLPQEPGDPKKDPSKNCYDCHKMPVLPFYPETVYKLDTKGRLVSEDAAIAKRVLRKLNDRIKAYGPPSFGFMDVGAYGPPLGPAVERSDDYLRRCSSGANLSDDSIAALRDAMMCGECHNSSGYGAINYPITIKSKRDSDFLQKVNMLQTFIDKGYMPPRSQLTDAEKRALFQCLQSEYLNLETGEGLLIDWLKGETKGSLL